MDPPRRDVRKLSVADGERNTRMWARVETDEAYAALARSICAQGFNRPPPGGPEEAARRRDEQIARAVKAVEKLRARGVPLLFARMPSAGDFLAAENRNLPRADLGCVARPHRCARHPFRGSCAVAGLSPARVVAPVVQRGDRFTSVFAPMAEAALAAQAGSK